LHKVAYGTEMIKPKHHWQQDVPAQIKQDGIVIDGWIVERLHLRTKQVAEHVDNTVRFERSVLSGVLNIHFREAAAGVGPHGLRGRTAPFHENALIADSMETFSMKVSRGDFVFRGEHLGMLTACIEEGGQLMALVETFEMIETVSAHSTRVRQSGNPAIWIAEELELAVAWITEPNGFVVIRIS
jgi:hypothetical protein